MNQSIDNVARKMPWPVILILVILLGLVIWSITSLFLYVDDRSLVVGNIISLSITVLLGFGILKRKSFIRLTLLVLSIVGIIFVLFAFFWFLNEGNGEVFDYAVYLGSIFVMGLLAILLSIQSTKQFFRSSHPSQE